MYGIAESKSGTSLIMQPVSNCYGKQYFVVNLETTKKADVYADSPDMACALVGWFRVNCFVKMMMPEIYYPLQKVMPER